MERVSDLEFSLTDKELQEAMEQAYQTGREGRGLERTNPFEPGLLHDEFHLGWMS